MKAATVEITGPDTLPDGPLLFVPTLRVTTADGVRLVGNVTPTRRVVEHLSVDPHELVETVAAMMSVAVSDIMGPSRTKRVVEARALVAWVLRTVAGWSFPELGRFFDRDHTTFVSLLRRVEALTSGTQRQHLLDSLGLAA